MTPTDAYCPSVRGSRRNRSPADRAALIATRASSVSSASVVVIPGNRTPVVVGSRGSDSFSSGILDSFVVELAEENRSLHVLFPRGPSKARSEPLAACTLSDMRIMLCEPRNV